ncbi:unnamed protein product [Thlaspi arvense]|uniref:Uncharacterized protein n=1 Tax=Thlaspi arvense TaxID=13288 RepID=A0AAU9R9F2_THLAR|nr:unnamed protein product [Thlaspi arvense]
MPVSAIFEFRELYTYLTIHRYVENRGYTETGYEKWRRNHMNNFGSKVVDIATSRSIRTTLHISTGHGEYNHQVSSQGESKGCSGCGCCKCSCLSLKGCFSYCKKPRCVSCCCSCPKFECWSCFGMRKCPNFP